MEFFPQFVTLSFSFVGHNWNAKRATSYFVMLLLLFSSSKSLNHFNIKRSHFPHTLKVAGISHNGRQRFQLVQCGHSFTLFHLRFTHFQWLLYYDWNSEWQKRFETISFISLFWSKLKTIWLKMQFMIAHTNPVRITAPIGINYVESSKHVSSTAIIYAHSTSNVIDDDVTDNVCMCVWFSLCTRACVCVYMCFCDSMFANRNRDITRMCALILSFGGPLKYSIDDSYFECSSVWAMMWLCGDSVHVVHWSQNKTNCLLAN